MWNVSRCLPWPQFFFSHSVQRHLCMQVYRHIGLWMCDMSSFGARVRKVCHIWCFGWNGRWCLYNRDDSISDNMEFDDSAVIPAFSVSVAIPIFMYPLFFPKNESTLNWEVVLTTEKILWFVIQYPSAQMGPKHCGHSAVVLMTLNLNHMFVQLDVNVYAICVQYIQHWSPVVQPLHTT